MLARTRMNTNGRDPRSIVADALSHFIRVPNIFIRIEKDEAARLKVKICYSASRSFFTNIDFF